MKKMLVLPLFFAASAFAYQHDAASQTRLTHCVIQEALPGKNMTGVFLNIARKGSAADIVAVRVPSITEHVEIHTMEMKGDVMEMKPLEDLRVHEGVRIFRKGADHVMLMNIPEHQLPKAGEKHALEMEFSDGEKARCQARVKTVEEIMKGKRKKSAPHQNDEQQHEHHHHH